MSATKFVAARNIKTGELVTFPEVRRQFFLAAQGSDSDKAIAKLRKELELGCPHCDPAHPARVHFNFASEKPDGTKKAIAGDNALGNRAHLSTNPNAIHTKGCTAVVIAGGRTETDPHKGYRLYINFGEIPERHPRNRQLITRNEEGRIIVLDEDLKDREVYTLSSAEDVPRLLRSGQFGRIRDSVAIHGNHKIPWDRFFIHRQTKGDHDLRMRGFCERLLEGKNLPALIDLEFIKASVTHKNNGNGHSRDYKFPAITGVIHPDSKQEITVIPRVSVDNEHLFMTFENLHRTQGEAFLLTRNARVFPSRDNPAIYMMYIDVRDPRMVTQANLRELKYEGEQNATYREASRKSSHESSHRAAPSQHPS